MVENKTSPCFLDQGNITSLSTKRHKADPSVSMKVFLFAPHYFKIE
ncbi:hypothetical protein LINPERHAP1_LOCUS42610 [Linum perenne]